MVAFTLFKNREPIRINPKFVASFYKKNFGGSIGTIINMSNGQSYFVVDTRDQVESRLGT